MNFLHSQRNMAVCRNTVWVFTLAELRRNLMIFLLPVPLWIGFQIYFWCSKTTILGLYGTWSVLIMAALFAMTYGLQCFSNETDKKTLDFILTRPLSPYLIISIKYGLSLTLLLSWFVVFNATIPFSIRLLHLVEGMGPAWLLLILLMIHAISFFSGLLAKGLERFFVVTVMTGILAGICYNIWSSCLDLLKANVYWLDILPAQLQFIQVILPTYLALLSLATPLIGTVWYLRSRIPLWHFSPAKWLIGLWFISWGVLFCCLRVFAPPVWPDDTAFYGEWHDRAGIVLSGPLKINGEDSIHKIKNNQVIPCHISLAQFGRKSRKIYSGKNIIQPRFSPDGRKIAFCEQRQIKIFDIRNRQLTYIGRGDLSAWSGDSRRLLYAHHIGKQNLSELYIYDIATKKTSQIALKLQISALAWDSFHDILYYLGYKTEVGSLNLKTNQLQSYTIKTDRDKPLNYYGIVVPNLIFITHPGLVVWGQSCEDELRIYLLDPKNSTIQLAENIVSCRMKNAAPVLINNEFKAFVWQRQAGSFVYQATMYYSHKGDHHHHHEHEEAED